MLAVRDEAIWWILERIIGSAAEHIGLSFFGAIGAVLASIIVYAVFKALKPDAKPTKPDTYDTLNEKLSTLGYHVAIFLLFVAASALIGFGGAVLLELLGRLFPAVAALSGERGAPIAWMVVTAFALAWFYRSSWRIVGVGLVVLLLVLCLALVRFGLLDDPLQWLAAVAIAVATFTLIWVHRAAWKVAIISVCSVALGLYFLGHKVPLGPLGLALCVGGAVVLVFASPGVATHRSQ
jgi:hypothetical protein